MPNSKRDLLEKAISLMENLELDFSLKSTLGEESLKPEFEPRIRQASRSLAATVDAVSQVTTRQVRSLYDCVSAFANLIFEMAKVDASVFLQNRASYVNQLNDLLDQLSEYLLPFRVAAQQLWMQKILGSPDATIGEVQDNLRLASEEILNGVRQEADRILTNAKDIAGEIQNTAHQTATGVSVIQAKIKFSDLLGTFKRGLIASGVLATIMLVVFFSYIYVLINSPVNFPSMIDAGYFAAIRLVFLASLAAMITFFLKIFRSNLHMYYHTLHRQQLTNSIEIFVDATRTQENRDAVLAKLIEAVSTFGTSGLITSSEDMPNTAKIIVDALPKMFSSKQEH